MTMHFPPTLLLNADFQPLSYLPLSTLGWKDAMKAVVEETHVVVANYDIDVRSTKSSIKLPSVLALRTYCPQNDPGFTRFNVFLRDKFICQYCAARFKADDLTFDHVIPRTQGGKTTWLNIASACHICNGLKAGRTPKEAGMPLLRAPYEPSAYELKDRGRAFPPSYLHETWNDYLYWDSPLEA